MNAHERIFRTLSHKEPDRVPTLAQSIEVPFKEKMVKDFNFREKMKYRFTHHNHLLLALKLGLDAIWLHYGGQNDHWRERPEIPNEIKKKYNIGKVNAYAHYSSKGSSGMNWYTDGALKTPEILRDWISYVKLWEPNPDIYYRHFKKVWDFYLSKNLVPTPTAGAVSWVTWSSIGINRFAYMVRKYKNLVKQLARAFGNITIELHKCFFEQGIDLIFVCDDWALKDRMIFSPEQWEEIIGPVYKDIADNAHKYNAKFLVHTDGNISECVPALIRAGADAIEPMEYESGMRVEDMKMKFGKEISLIGNVSATHILTYGTIKDTINETKYQLSKGAHDGGYILAPGSDILGTCKPENVKAMVDTVKKFGKYPIKIDLEK